MAFHKPLFCLAVPVPLSPNCKVIARADITEKSYISVDSNREQGNPRRERALFLSMKIVATVDLFKELEKRNAGLRYNIGMFKPFFATDKKLFFDCSKTEDRKACLRKVLARQDFEDFSVLSVVKEEEKPTGKPVYTVNESKFVRIGREKPEDFINRYNKNLKEPTTLSMQLFGVQPIELIGFSYTSPEERAELMKE